MAFMATLTITLLASAFTFSRALDHPYGTRSNATLSTAYSAHRTIPASPLAENQNNRAKTGAGGMHCLTPTVTVTVTTSTSTSTTTMDTRLASTNTTTTLVTPHTRCANTTITGLPIGPLIVCAPPSTTANAHETSASSPLPDDTDSVPTSALPEDAGSESKAAATAAARPATPPPTTVFVTVTRTADPAPVPFEDTSAFPHVSQPFRGSETPAPTLSATTPAGDEESSGAGTGLPRFTLEPEPTGAPPGELETSSGLVEGAATLAPEPSTSTPTETAATGMETEQNQDTAWSGVDGALPWQLLNPPLARRGRRASRVGAGMKGVSRAGAPHLEPAKAKAKRERGKWM
ncbi:hypothetical protein B5807_05684 [Epicoccum nigrum]|uniref:Uncharacterized protein n=1 Tax=Epicoccum nigrum TaxID=105696 RepID=A0A1Y2LZG2_EPING|nr:hypothetical protein B5807_05684 [Epicoccum nigrum]